LNAVATIEGSGRTDIYDVGVVYPACDLMPPLRWGYLVIAFGSLLFLSLSVMFIYAFVSKGKRRENEKNAK